MDTLWVGCWSDEDAEVPGLVRFGVSGAHLERQGEWPLAAACWLASPPARPTTAATGSTPSSSLWAVQHLPRSAVRQVVWSGADLTVGEPIATHGADACHGELNPSATALAVAHYTSGTLAVVDLATGAVTTVGFAGHSGIDAQRQEAPHAHQAAWLDDHHLAVCDLGADAVRIVRWHDGELTEIGAVETGAGCGPRHLVLRERSGVSGFAVAGELSGEVAFYRHTGKDWAQGWKHMSSVSGSLVGGGQPSALRALDADTLVLANRGINTLSILDWDDDGLILLDEFDCGGDHTRDLVVHDDRLWVANLGSGDVCCFERPQGAWTLASRTPIERPASLLFTH